MKAIRTNFSGPLHCTRVVYDSVVAELNLTLAYKDDCAFGDLASGIVIGYVAKRPLVQGQLFTLGPRE